LNFRKTILRIAAIAFSVASLSCDETLPPRIEPARFLKAAIHVQPNSFVEVFIDSMAPGQPITIVGSSGKLELSLKSFFNEVLQEKPFISGNLDVWLTSQPTVRTKVVFTEVNVDYPYIEPGGYLTLVPGDSVLMTKQWHHIADNGRGFWNFVQLRGKFDGRFYFESAPVRYTAVATIRTFENVPAEKTEPYEFALIYKVYVRYPP
jgi:hypothetical protein